MTVEARAARALEAAFRHFGTDAVFTPESGPAGTVRIHETRGDAELRPGFNAAGRSDTVVVQVRAADLSEIGVDRAPQAGDAIAWGGQTWAVKSARAEDRLKLVWAVDLKPA